MATFFRLLLLFVVWVDFMFLGCCLLFFLGGCYHTGGWKETPGVCSGRLLIYF